MRCIPSGFVPSILVGVLLVVIGCVSSAPNQKSFELHLQSRYVQQALELEAAEFLHEHSPSLFWRFVQEFERLGGQASEQDKHEHAVKAIRNVFDESLSTATDKSLGFPLLEYALAVHQFAPKLEAAKSVYTDAISQLSRGSVTKDTLKQSAFVVLPDGSVYTSLDTSALQQRLRVAMHTDPNALRSKVNADFANFENTTGVPASVWAALGPADHVFPGTEDGILPLIMYCELGTATCKKMLNSVVETAKNSPDRIRLSVRFVQKLSPTHSQDYYDLQGFGVKVDIKNMEYKVVDDSVQHEGGDESGDFNEIASDSLSEQDGVIFSTLVERYPSLRDNLIEMHNDLKSLAEEKESETEENKDSKSYNVWQLQNLGLVAAQRILRRQDESALTMLESVSQNLPSYMPVLVRAKSSSKVEKAVKKLHEIVEAGESILTINGVDFSLDSGTPFHLFHQLQSEWKSHGFFDHLHIDASLRSMMLEGVHPERDQNARFRTPTSVVTILNNLEKDSQYKRWGKDLSGIANAYPGQMAFVARNLYTAILVVDPGYTSSLQAINGIMNYIQRNAPVRFGIIFYTGARLSHPVATESDDTTDMHVSEMVVRAYYALKHFIYDRDTRSKSATRKAQASMTFFTSIMQHLGMEEQQDTVPEEIVRSVVTGILNRNKKALRDGESVNAILDQIFSTMGSGDSLPMTVEDQIEECEEFVRGMGLSEAASPFFFMNGKLVTGSSAVQDMVQSVFAEQQTMQHLILNGELSRETTNIYRKVMDIYSAYDQFNADIFNIEIPPVESTASERHSRPTHAGASASVDTFVPLRAMHPDTDEEYRQSIMNSPVSELSRDQFVERVLARMQWMHRACGDPFASLSTIVALDTSADASHMHLINVLHSLVDSEWSDDICVRFAVVNVGWNGDFSVEAYNARKEQIVLTVKESVTADNIRTILENTGDSYDGADDDVFQYFVETYILNADISSAGNKLDASIMAAREQERFAAEILGYSPRTFASGAIAINGRVIPLSKGWELSHWKIAHMYEHSYRASAVFHALSGRTESTDDAQMRWMADLVQAIVSTLHSHAAQSKGHSPLGGDAHSTHFHKHLDLQHIVREGEGLDPIRLKLTHPDAVINVQCIMNPLSKEAQKYSTYLRVLHQHFHANVTLVLNPMLNIEEVPLKHYYTMVLEPTIRFFDDEQIGLRGRAFASGDRRPTPAVLTELPTDIILTVQIDPPESWMVVQTDSTFDLDNLLLSDLGDRPVLRARYELESLIIDGHCYDNTMHKPPRGLQLQLGTVVNPHVTDTLVMSNYGYFQLKANPGVWNVRIAPGRHSEFYSIDSVVSSMSHVSGEDGDVDNAEHTVIVDSWLGQLALLHVHKQPGLEMMDLLADEKDDSGRDRPRINLDDDDDEDDDNGFWKKLKSIMGSDDDEDDAGEVVAEETIEAGNEVDVVEKKKETVHVFSIASGFLYERFLKIMILSVMNHTKESNVKFWFLKNYMSARLYRTLPLMAEKYKFEYELVTYKWPSWLHKQTEKQRIIWAYKVLFLDVLFPLDVEKVVFIDADQIVRTDLTELFKVNLRGAPVAFTPFCDSRTDMEGFRFWKNGYWSQHLAGRPYHISAMFVVDLKRFRQTAAGDQWRYFYDNLSKDPNSLSNLDQDLPNYASFDVPIFSLPQDWLWCDSWCSAGTKESAKIIDLCNNPQTKEPKLDAAKRIIPEWTAYDEDVRALEDEVAAMV